jgi:Ca2+-binding RTX toxin-like protein
MTAKMVSRPHWGGQASKEYDVFSEKLEGRRLLSFTAHLTTDYTLVLVGTPSDDDAVVRQVQAGSGLVEVIDYSDPLNPVAHPWFEDVERISVDMGDGFDGVKLITYDLPAVLAGGDHNDIINIENGNSSEYPIPTALGATIVINAGEGDDQALIWDYGNVGTIYFAGEGDDYGKVHEASKNDLRPTVLSGDNGNDILEGAGAFTLFIDGNGDGDWNDLDEDLNSDGILNPGEDRDSDGVLDLHREYIDAHGNLFDLNGNGVLDWWQDTSDWYQDGDAGSGYCLLLGGNGRDTLTGHNGTTTLDGGNGKDIVIVDAANPGIISNAESIQFITAVQT